MGRTKTFDREEILIKAMELFWTKGFHGTSMQNLVDHLGINRASLYDTYGDKYQLFLETLVYYRNEQSQYINSILQNQNNVLGFLHDFLMNGIEDEEMDKKGCYMVNTSIDMAPHDEKINKLVVGNMLSFEQKFTQFFQIAQDSGAISRKRSPQHLARFLYNTSIGIRIIARTIDDPKAIEEIVDTALEVFRD